MNIIEQLTNIYLNKEFWHKNKLSESEANLYHERLLMQGNIITYIRDNELLGYLEYYRINFEQLGRIMCNYTLAHNEDLLSGNIAFINRMWIREDYRNSIPYITLSKEFLIKNKDANMFVAIQNHKKHKPFQIYSRDELLKFYK